MTNKPDQNSDAPLQDSFKEQGGAATMDPSFIRRWLTSRMMSRMSSEQVQNRTRAKAEQRRKKLGLPHTIEYFHQVDDGYSHLAVQLLANLQQRYDVDLRCHLVSECAGANLPEPQLLAKLSANDANQIAPYYGLESCGSNTLASADCVALAEAILAGLSNDNFITHAATISAAVWRNDQQALQALADQFGQATETQVQSVIKNGNARRAELKHYSGAMFYYAGEWYWGVDRLHHLESRLRELGLDSTPNKPLLAPRKDVVNGPLNASNSAAQSSQISLVIYASLRSPYTAVAFDQTVKLAEDLGVNLQLRPVLPMVMRGVPATMEKGQYILFDAGREARAAGVPFGPCADPIGEPTRRAYSLFSWAEQQGKAVKFFSSFLHCAWVDAVNTNSDKGMQQVVERAGLDWTAAKTVIDQSGWQADLEKNRLAMYELGLWGVPSYQVVSEQGSTVLAVWGQDRLWLVAQTIQDQLKRLAKDK